MIPERREAILAALADGPRTTREIIATTGLNKDVVLRYGRRLVEEEALVCTRVRAEGMGGAPQCVWRLA